MTVNFTFDQAKCTGCQACILACTIENGLAFDQSWRTVYTYNERHYPTLPVQHLSLSCNHCEHAACLDACPANAYSINNDTGFVEFDETKCIGCRYCTWACPFGAPRFDGSKGVVGKCTFCSDRQKAGSQPACVELCPTGALGVDVQEEEGRQPKVPGFPITSLEPAITITPANENRTFTENTEPQPGKPFVPERMYGAMGPTLRTEWPLISFTFMVPVLVGVLSASVFTAHRPSPWVFIGISALAALVSTAHLGKKARAWRAVLNPGSSWLSREVSLFGALAVCGTVYFTFAPSITPIAWAALAIGFATLISVDRVYETLPLIEPRRYHSANAILTGLFYVGVLTLNPLVAGAIGLGKFLLYVKRKIEFRRLGKPSRPTLSAIRIVIGFLVPTLAWIFVGGEVFPIVIATILLGELIDRTEFYAELDFVTPEKQVAIDLQRAISA